jgi:beta-1,4-mannooligosaccharide/beta-1,4-mannosyl-N-acetylglucosamine phosphorylase
MINGRASAAKRAIVRHPLNPVLEPSGAPYESTTAFNAGVAKFQGRYVMLFRNVYGFTKEQMQERCGKGQGWPETKSSLGLAFSRDGVKWEVQGKPVEIPLELKGAGCAYDPRLTVIDGVCHVCFAVDTPNGIRGGVARTEDFAKFEVLSLSSPDNRNMVLFPERIGGRYVRLERPFPVYGRGGKELFDIWHADSADLRSWGGQKLVLDARDVPFAKGKIGPGAPPVKTRKGWLAAIHAVALGDEELVSWHGGWRKTYYAGLMLLDLDDPSKVIGLAREPLLAPEAAYELDGFRGSVIFPGGMVLEDSGEVKIYYGAADTVECLATAHIDDLLELCAPCR